MMTQPVRVYIRAQGIIAAVINMALNPLISWARNPRMEYMSLAGDNGILVDAAATAVILSLLVSLFVTAGVRREVKAGRLAAASGPTGGGGLLPRLPRAAWALGLAIGLLVALAIVPFILGLFRLAALPGLPFRKFVLLKAAATALLGYAVTRWVIIRQLA
ncbi:MAG: hypothetical protein PHN82_08555 [bacterium]|nr:hypothetical protein [bacterium]